MQFVPPRPCSAAHFAAVVALLGALGAGCGRPPTVVGTWSGAAGPARAQLVLGEGGTGTMQLPPLIAEVPVTWEEEGKGRVTLHVDGARVGAAPDQKREGQIPLPATLSEDGDTLTITQFPLLSELRLTRNTDAE